MLQVLQWFPPANKVKSSSLKWSARPCMTWSLYPLQNHISAWLPTHQQLAPHSFISIPLLTSISHWVSLLLYECTGDSHLREFFPWYSFCLELYRVTWLVSITAFSILLKCLLTDAFLTSLCLLPTPGDPHPWPCSTALFTTCYPLYFIYFLFILLLKTPAMWRQNLICFVLGFISRVMNAPRKWAPN